MSRTDVSTSSGGIGLFGVLGIVFIVLKLVGVIDWSWWWVLLPIYGPLVLILIGTVIAFAIFVIVQLWQTKGVR